MALAGLVVRLSALLVVIAPSGLNWKDGRGGKISLSCAPRLTVIGNDIGNSAMRGTWVLGRVILVNHGAGPHLPRLRIAAEIVCVVL